MTEMRDAIIFVGVWRPQMPPSPDATTLNYLNDRERGAPLSFVGFWRPPMPPPPDATILNYLTDREGRRRTICAGDRQIGNIQLYCL